MSPRSVCVLALLLSLAAPVSAQENTDQPESPNKTKIVVEGESETKKKFKDSPVAATALTKEEIEKHVPEDLGDAIKSHPGVYTQRTAAGQASPMIRGMTGKQVLLLIDGMRFSNAAFRSGPNQYFASIDPFAVESMEIFRGPYSVRYGSDALGGLINVRMRNPEFYGPDGGFNFGVRGRYTSANRGKRLTLDAPFSLAGERLAGWGSLTFGDYEEIDGGRTTGEQPATSYHEWSGTAGLRYRLSDAWTLDWRFAHNQKHDVFRTDKNSIKQIAPNKLPTDGFGNPIPADTLRVWPRQDDYFSSLRLSYAGSGSLESAALSLYYHRVDEELHRITNGSPNTLRDQFFNDTTIGLRGEAIFNWGDSSRLTVGADLTYDYINAGHDRIDLTTGVRTNRDDIAQFPDNSTYVSAGLFAEDEIWLADGLFELRPGIRVSLFAADAEVSKFDASLDDVSETFADVTASVALAWHPNEWLTPSIQIARGFRAPNLDDLAANKNAGAGDEIPNPDLDPEELLAAQIGVRAFLDKSSPDAVAPYRLNASAFYYEHWLFNAAIRQPTTFNGNTVNQLMNVGRARIRGLEFGVEYFFGDELEGIGLDPKNIFSEGDALGIWGTLTYTKGDNLTEKEPFERIPPVMAGLGLRYLFAGGKGFIEPSMQMWGSQDRISPNRNGDPRFANEETAGFTLYHLSMGWKPSENVKFGMRVNNITNKNYHIHGSGVLGTGTDFRLFTEIRW